MLTCVYTTTSSDTPVTQNYNTYTNLKTQLTQNSNFKTILKTVSLTGSGSDTSMNEIFSGCSALTSVSLNNDSTNVAQMENLFFNCTSLTSITFGDNFNTSNTTKMTYLFYGCSALTTVDVSSFDTSKGYSMKGMFYGCSSLTSLDLSNFDTSNVTFMQFMFYGCSSLTSLDLSSFKTSKVMTIESMFENCSNLKTIDLSNFSSGRFYQISRAFYGCSSLVNLDLSNLSMPNILEASEVFRGCSNLENIYSSYDWSKANPNNSQNMFLGCVKLKNYNASYVDVQRANTNGYFTPAMYLKLRYTTTTVPVYQTLYAENYESLKSKFPDNMKKVILSGKAYSSGTDLVSAAELFKGQTGITSINLNNLDFSNVNDMTAMFWGCSLLQEANLENLGTENVEDMRSLFYGCESLASVNLSGLDTSNVTYMTAMFFDCSNLTELDVSNFDTSLVKNMALMFSDCSSLVSLNLLNFDTKLVTDMHGMFCDCSSLTSLNLSNFDTSNVTDMGLMFFYCESLESIDLTSFNTSNVTDMSCMFKYCENLESINLSSFDVSQVIDMHDMFYGCASLTSLDLSNFDTTNLTSMKCMFKNCSSLKELDISTFYVFNVASIEELFYGCSSLISLDMLALNFSQDTLETCKDAFKGCSSLEDIFYNGDLMYRGATDIQTDFSSWLLSKTVAGTKCGSRTSNAIISPEVETTETYTVYINGTEIDDYPLELNDTLSVVTEEYYDGYTDYSLVSDAANQSGKISATDESYTSILNNVTLTQYYPALDIALNISCAHHNDDYSHAYSNSNIETSFVPRVLDDTISFSYGSTTLVSKVLGYGEILYAGDISLLTGGTPSSSPAFLYYYSPDEGKTGLLVYDDTDPTSPITANLRKGISDKYCYNIASGTTFSDDDIGKTVNIVYNDRTYSSQIEVDRNNFNTSVYFIRINMADNLEPPRSGAGAYPNILLCYCSVAAQGSGGTYPAGMTIGISTGITPLPTQITGVSAFIGQPNSIHGDASEVYLLNGQSVTIGRQTSSGSAYSEYTGTIGTITVDEQSYLGYKAIDTSTEKFIIYAKDSSNIRMIYYNSSTAPYIGEDNFEYSIGTNVSIPIFTNETATYESIGDDYAFVYEYSGSLLTSSDIGNSINITLPNLSPITETVRQELYFLGEGYCCTHNYDLNTCTVLAYPAFYFYTVPTDQGWYSGLQVFLSGTHSVGDTILVSASKGGIAHENVWKCEASGLTLTVGDALSAKFRNTDYSATVVQKTESGNTYKIAYFKDSDGEQLIVYEDLTDNKNYLKYTLSSGEEELPWILVFSLYGGSSFTKQKKSMLYKNLTEIKGTNGSVSGEFTYDGTKLCDLSSAIDVPFTLRMVTEAAQTETVFEGCTNLAGQIVYDSTKISNQYANSNNGYFLPKKYNLKCVFTVSGGTGYVSTFDTYSAVKNWISSYSPISLKLSGKDYATDLTASMANLFLNKSTLTSIDLSRLDTSNVINTSYLFSGCTGLTTLNFTNFPDFDTAAVTNMSYMFNNCSGLITLNVSTIDTKNVTTMEYMFYNCSNITSLDLSNFETSKLSNMKKMLGACSKVTSLDLSSFDTKNVTNMMGVFNGCSDLTSLDVSSFNTESATDMSYLFSGCSDLATLDIDNFDTANVTNMEGLFQNCNSLEEIDLSIFETTNVTNMKYMFSGCSSITELAVEYMDTANVVNMQGMFLGCSKLKELDVFSFDTRKVTNLQSMFYNCSLLETIYCNNNWYSSSTLLPISDYMFANCTSLAGATSYPNAGSTATAANPTNGYFTGNFSAISKFTYHYNYF